MHRNHVVPEPHLEASERSLAAPRLLASALTALLLVVTACTSSEEAAPSEPSAPAPAAPVQTSQRLFSNGGFEDGTLTGWTVSTNLNNGIAVVPPTSKGDLALQPGGTPRTYARNAPGGPESQVPAGLDATASLRWPKYGNNAAVVNELGNQRNVNRLVQAATVTSADVDPADGKVHVRFALAPVLQNPGHTDVQQPYFYMELRNMTRGAVLWYTFNFANQAGVPWKTFGSGNNAVNYTDWQSVDVAPGDAKLSVGDSIELEVVAAGCQPSAHWGHVYVDGFGAFLPGLSIAASAPQFANDDTDLTYTYLAKNSGSTPTANTQVTIVLPDNTAYVSYNGATCTRATVNGKDTLTCDLGTLNPTASAQFEVTVHINQGVTGTINHGNYDIQATNVSPLIGPLVVTNVSAGVPYSDLAITLTDGVSAVAWNDPVQYTMVVTNNGPVAATGAAIDDAFPAQLTGITWTCAGSSGATCATASGSGDIHVTNDLPVGGTLTFTVSATVINGSSSGTLDNRASVTVASPARDNDTSNNTAVDIDGIGTLYTLTVSKDPAGTGAGTIISSPTSINCDVNCTSQSARFLEGSQVSLTATAAPGSTFAGWSGACANQPNPCTVDMTAATNVVALFTLNTYPVTVNIPGGGGTITCTNPVGYGQNATCIVTPEPGYALATLTDNGTDVFGGVTGNSYVITNVTDPHELVGTFKKELGANCGGNSECSSNVCADGVCCNSACDGQCEACNVAGSVGTCSPVTGAPHSGKSACATDGSVCGGSCDGTNRTACTFPGTSTECQAGSCSGGVATLPVTCDGAGSCPAAAPQTEQCNPYVCGPNACLDHCTTDADCAGNRFCDAGACVDRRDNGGSCTADSQCASGSCADGVCCNTACDGQCEACNVAGSVGTCSAVTGAPRGDRPACASDGSECGGVCDGTVRNTCTYPTAATHCGAEACTDGMATTGGTCNGTGACGQETQSCGLYACGDKACNSACSSDAQCSAGGICLSGQCMDRADRELWKAEGSGCSSTGSGSSLGATLVLAVLALLSRRRKAVGALLSTAVVLSVPAAAQAQEDLDRSFTVERFQPQPGQADILGVQSAQTGENLSFSARIFASYAHQPLRLVSTADSNFRRLMVGNQSQFTLTASMAFQDRFEVGLAVPVLLHQTTETIGIIDPRLDGGLKSTAIEDLRLSVKANLLRDEDYGLAVSLPITLPTAPGNNYTGGAGVEFNPTVIGEMAGPRNSSFMANAGLLLGRSRQFLNLDLGTALTYGVGGKVDLVPSWNLAFLTTLAGEVGLSHPSAETSPLELLLGLRWGFMKNMEATLGAGPGLTNGYGTPRYRILAALSWVPGSKPAPAPVIAPAPPPPAPAPPPPPPPALVARKDEAKVKSGEAVSISVLGNDEGAPGEAIQLVEVSSPSGGQVEMLPDGTVKYTAKPGFSGREELTYKIKGADGREATGTLVVNVEAPPPPPPPPAAAVVDVSSGKIRVLEKVNFATNKDNALAESLHILDDVYSIMSSDASIKRIRIEAHTDNQGTPSYNKDLSDRRAKWVKNYLIQKGIDPSRLDSAGFGQTRPIATNKTAEGRAANRRVEFVILP